MRMFLAATACAALLCGVEARAATYDFTFTGTSPATDASGIITTSNTLDAVGGYDVTSISGFVGGSPISGLVPNPLQPAPSYYQFNDPEGDYFYYDNVLFYPVSSPAAYVDNSGILFTSGGNFYNIYAYSAQTVPTVLGLYTGSGFIDTNGTLTVTAVPEPANWALMLIGFGVAGAGLRVNRGRMKLASAPR